MSVLSACVGWRVHCRSRTCLTPTAGWRRCSLQCTTAVGPPPPPRLQHRLVPRQPRHGTWTRINVHAHVDLVRTDFKADATIVFHVQKPMPARVRATPQSLFLDGIMVGTVQETAEDYVLAAVNVHGAAALRSALPQPELTQEDRALYAQIKEVLVPDLEDYWASSEFKATLDTMNDSDPVDVIRAWVPQEDPMLLSLEPMFGPWTATLKQQRPGMLEQFAERDAIFVKQQKTFVGALIVTMLSVTVSVLTLYLNAWATTSIIEELTKVGALLTAVVMGFLDFIRAFFHQKSLLRISREFVCELARLDKEWMLALNALARLRALDASRKQQAFAEYAQRAKDLRRGAPAP